MLKNLPKEVIKQLVDIMNKAMIEKKIPEEWEHARIYPIYKKTGTEYDPNNYRPIALLSIPYKIYTTIINRRIANTLERFDLLTPEQTGFRKNMDTSLNIATLREIISDSVTNKKPIHTVFIDLSKAYDTIQH